MASYVLFEHLILALLPIKFFYIITSTPLQRLSTRFWKAVGVCSVGHKTLVRPCQVRRPGVLVFQFIQKKVQSGWGQGSMQASWFFHFNLDKPCLYWPRFVHGGYSGTCWSTVVSVASTLLFWYSGQLWANFSASSLEKTHLGSEVRFTQAYVYTSLTLNEARANFLLVYLCHDIQLLRDYCMWQRTTVMWTVRFLHDLQMSLPTVSAHC